MIEPQHPRRNLLAHQPWSPIMVSQEDNPSNVIGISPVTMILNSVAVMLIFDLDDKAFTMIKGVAYVHTLTLTLALSLTLSSTTRLSP
jgi:hypothetical protein